jgi:hypothetical protein
MPCSSCWLDGDDDDDDEDDRDDEDDEDDEDALLRINDKRS